MGNATTNRLQQSVEWHEWVWEKPAFYRSQGVDVLPMRGAPRDNPPPHVIEAGQRAAGYNTDIDDRGTQEFREAVARKLLRDSAVRANPEREIMATNGAMNAMFIALASLVRAHDEIIAPTPEFYYWNSIEILNGATVQVPTSERDGWAWDIEAIEAAVTPRTRAIVYTNPCNPHGMLPDRDHLLALGDVAERHDLVLIEDQTYEKFVHRGNRVTSAGAVEGLWERTLIVYGFHKNYSMHAWRTGFLAGAAHLIDALKTVSLWVNLRCSHISQAAAAAALEGPQDWVQDVVRPFREGRDKLLEGLADDPGITMAIPVQGGTHGYMRVEGLGRPSREVSERLLADYGVHTVPGACFGPTRDSGEHIRVPFSLERGYPGSYDEVVARLKRASADLRRD